MNPTYKSNEAAFNHSTKLRYGPNPFFPKQAATEKCNVNDRVIIVKIQSAHVSKALARYNIVDFDFPGSQDSVISMSFSCQQNNIPIALCNERVLDV